MEKCELCPRRCNAPRFAPGSTAGWCGAGNVPRVFRSGLHFGEEPPITGERGSGCIFFSRCTMRCAYCQNSPWSWRGEGTDISTGDLADIMRRLAVEDRAENWNLVSPTPYLPFIRDAAEMLSDEGIKLPFVWNSSGYERVETLEMYKNLCDWALFDLRYSRDETASALSGAPGYTRHAHDAVKWAWEKSEKGKSQTGGLIVRILVIPGHAGEAKENLQWLASEISEDVPVSIMSQYTPAYMAKTMPPLDRSVSREEYEDVVDTAENLGFGNGWTQDLASSDAKLAFLGENMSPGHSAVQN